MWGDGEVVEREREDDEVEQGGGGLEEVEEVGVGEEGVGGDDEDSDCGGVMSDKAFGEVEDRDQVAIAGAREEDDVRLGWDHH